MPPGSASTAGRKFLDAFLGDLRLGGIGVFADDFVIINESGAGIVLGLVKLGDIEGALRLSLAELLDIFLRLNGLVAVGIADEIILEGVDGLFRRAHVVVAGAGGTHPGVADLVLRVGGDGAGRVIIEHDLVGVDGVGVFALLFAGQADVELALRGVGAVGRVLDDALVHLDGAFHRRADGNFPDALRLAGEIEIGDAVLLVERLLEIVAGGILRHHFLEGLERVVEVGLVLEDFADAVLGFRREKGERPAAQQALVGLEGGVALALGLELVGEFELVARTGGGDVAAAFVRPAFAGTPDQRGMGKGGGESQRERLREEGFGGFA